MKFECLDCLQPIEARDVYAGRQIECPSCGKSIIIPDAPTASEPPLPLAAPKEVATKETPAIRSAHLLSGDASIHRYTLQGELARGGMGAVFLAEDVNLCRPVAQKRLIDPQQVSDSEIARFIEEARVTGQLEHPSIVPIHELGIDSGGDIYYTMKRIKGITLSDVLDGFQSGDQKILQHWSLPRLLRAFQRVCDAVGFAHAKGVVHRDLKPENIMMGEFGEVILLDWGIAKILDRAGPSSEISQSPRSGARVTAIRGGSDASLLTLSGDIMGTPMYMSPEQVTTCHSVDARADIFSLGAILYEILALAPPYQGTNVREILELAREANYRSLEVIEKQALRKKRRWPHLPGGRMPAPVSAIATKAIAKNPQDRYETVAAMQADLDAYLNGFATEAENAGLGRLLWLFLSRHRVAALFSAALLSVLIAGLVVNFRERKIAQANLSRFLDEKEARAKDRSLSAPQFIALARQLIEEGDRETATTLANLAVEYAPENPEGYTVLAALASSNREWERVRAECEAALNAGSEHSGKIRTLLEASGRVEKSSSETELQSLGDALADLEFHSLAALVASDAKARLQRYKNQLTNAWGPEGFKDNNGWTLNFKSNGMTFITGSPDTISPFYWYHPDNSFPNEFDHFDLSRKLSLETKGNGPFIEKLEKAAGLPIEIFMIHHETIGMASLAPLSSFKNLQIIEALNVRSTDLTPLERLDLKSLRFSYRGSDSPPIDLSPLAEMENLTFLSCYRCSPISLTPLAGKPIKQLKIDKLNGTSALRNLTQIEKLYLDHSTVDFTHLSELPLKYLEISNCNFDDANLHCVRDTRTLLLHSSDLHSLAGLKGGDVRYLSAGLSSNGVDKLADLSPLKDVPALRGFRTYHSGNHLLPLAETSIDELHLRDYLNFPHLSHFNLAPLVDAKTIRTIRVDPECHVDLLTPEIALAMAQQDWQQARSELESFSKRVHANPAFHFARPRLDAIDTAIVQSEKGEDSEYLSTVRQFKGHRYQWIGLALPWAEAERFCERLGGHLVTINSADEWKWLNLDFLKKELKFPRYNMIWVGATDLGHKGTWQWITGEPFDRKVAGTMDLDDFAGKDRVLGIYHGGHHQGGMLQLGPDGPTKNVKAYLRDRQGEEAWTFVVEWDK
ncbi:MAG: protein kinase [Verrucomicrobiales bacterium]|nr:protein kinase [Verrucomicrobiales bacterium]